MDWLDFSQRAITVPFLEKGRSYDGWDCWGLIVCGYRDVLNIDLPGYESQYSTTRDLKTLRAVFCAERDAKWTEVPRAIGSVALILRRNREVHVGVAVTRRDILHCERGVGTVLDRDRDLRIAAFGVPA